MSKVSKKLRQRRSRKSLSDKIGLPISKPSEAYHEAITAYGSSLFDSVSLSKELSGIPSPTTQHFYSSALFTTMCTRGMSIAMLLPKSIWSDQLIDHWDYRSIAILVRSLVETRLALHYLCVEQCEESEWRSRWNIFNLHDCVTRRRIAAERTSEEEILKPFDDQADKLRKRLRENAFFSGLKGKRQKSLLKGREAYLKSLEEIAEDTGMEKNIWRRMNIILSNHVHTLPYSFYNMEQSVSGRGLHDHREEHGIMICLGYADMMLIAARREMNALFDGIKPRE